MQKNGSLPWQGPVGRDFPPKTEVSPQNHFASLRLETPIISEKILKPNKAVLGVTGKDSGAWIVFSTILLVKGKGFKRASQI